VDHRSNHDEKACAPDSCDDSFAELCALSMTGGLSRAEWKKLDLHLSHCALCRERKAQYEGVMATRLPALAADHTQIEDDHTSDSWSIEKAEASLMARIEQENISPDQDPQPSTTTSRGRHLWWPYAGAALFLVLSIDAGYRLGALHERRLSAAVPIPKVDTNHERPDQFQAQVISTPETGENERRAEEESELRRQLRASRVEAGRLEAQKNSLENELALRKADIDRNTQQRVDLERQLSVAQTDAQSLHDRLGLLTARSSQDATQAQTLETRLEELNASLRNKDQDLAEDEELLQHDRDIRNLIGARDLYIAEIYDIAKTGKTQKPFGRVFYTKGKSLVFYAYDLDQQPGVKLASIFQAWGQKGIDRQHAVNLGIFYQDEENKKRWILKSNDSLTLAEIDAVFVTVEPNGESSKPTGKPLLFTYLRLTPNHP
jgi:hypothetical protein